MIRLNANIWRLIVLGAASFVAQPLGAQLQPLELPTSPLQQPQSYSDYYRNQLNMNYRPNPSVRDYTINRYFYNRPTLSPYLNLTRRSGPDTLNNYYRYVLPQINRREALASEPFRPLPNETASVAPPIPFEGPIHTAVQNPYFNQFYNPSQAKNLTVQPLPPKPTPLPKLTP